MITKTIKVDFTTVDKVYHIADIHIRNLRRHTEFRGVFEKFYEALQSEKSKNVLIVIAGDLVHSKSEISPELVQEVSSFLSKCSDLFPTLLIAGNHDTNLNNSERLDALTPIITNLGHKNLFYLRESGIYIVADCTFTVMSVFDKPDTYIKAKDVPSSSTKIALFHGAVKDSVTDIGYVITDKRVTTNLFDGYDIVMMGDIHKYQVLKDANPVIVYPGSMIQQNYGESTTHHGYLLWNIPKRIFKHVELENEYGFFTIDVKDGKLITDIKNMPKRAKLRVRCVETVPSEVKKIISKIRQKYEISDLTFVNGLLTDSKKEAIEKINLENLSDVTYQNTLITEYLTANFDIDADTLEEVLKINKEINTLNTDTETFSRNIRWIPKKLEWDNLFSYGEGNVIDFTKTKDVLGLFGKNTSGKTSAVEVLTFCIYDRCSRDFKPANIMNSSKMSFMCKFTFEINNEEYVIHRTGKKNKKGDLTITVDFTKTNKTSGKPESLNGDARFGTNASIRKYVGTYDDFILTSLSQQKNTEANFVERTQSERKDLLAKFLGINIFDKLETIASDKNKELSILMKRINKATYTQNITDQEVTLDKCSAELFSKRNELDVLETQKIRETELSADIWKEYKTLADGLTLSIEDAESILQDTIDKLEQAQEEVSKYEPTVKLMEESLEKIEEKISSYDFTEINNNNTLHFVALAQKIEIERDIENLKRIVADKLKKLKQLAEHKYDPNCDFCINNVFVKDATETQKTLENDKEQSTILLNNLAEITSRVEELAPFNVQFNELEKINHQKYTINSNVMMMQKKLASLKSAVDTIQQRVISETNRVKLTRDNIDAIENNRLVKEKEDMNKNQISLLARQINVTKQEVIVLFSAQMSYNTALSKLQSELAEATDLEKQYNSYKMYLEAVKRDGIPYQLIGKALPAIENEINNILTQIVDFVVVLTMDGKNVNAHIVYEEQTWPLDMGSGMESFISSIAIRVALTNISNLPRPNFLILDEGLGCLDSDNLASMYSLFTYLKTNFDFIIVISHLEAVKDMVDSTMDIKKENGFSSIKYV
jgi:DNA repair exonuclease SbcCD ATPase subunit/DNA repair exonuclease SbcCD nuclease subunit